MLALSLPCGRQVATAGSPKTGAWKRSPEHRSARSVAERGWQRFVLSWRAPDPGVVVLCSRVYSHDGARQPEFERRNVIHRIAVKVV
jgi:hypothetical protein